MASYRIYCLDAAGNIGLADWIEAACDDAALTMARTLRPDAHKCEVWQGKRLVARLGLSGSFDRTTAIV